MEVSPWYGPSILGSLDTYCITIRPRVRTSEDPLHFGLEPYEDYISGFVHIWGFPKLGAPFEGSS